MKIFGLEITKRNKQPIQEYPREDAATSLIFGDIYNKYDFVSIFSYNGEKYKYSIYSGNIKFSEIPKRIINQQI